jgi:hypothetical protein
MQIFRTFSLTSSLSRPIDPRYPSNLAIMLATVAVGALTLGLALLDQRPLLEGLIWAVNWAGATLIAWILARELDPDHVMTSAIAPLLTLGALVAFDWRADLVVATLLIITVRALNRTTGLMTQPIDIPAYFAIVILVGWTPFWALGGLVVLAFLAERWLPQPYPKALAVAIALGLLTVATPILTQPSISYRPIELSYLLVAVVVVVWYLAVWRWQPQLFSSVCDRYDKPLLRERVIAGQAFLILAWVLLLLLYGEAGLQASAPLGGAITAFLGYQTYVALR